MAQENKATGISKIKISNRPKFQRVEPFAPTRIESLDFRLVTIKENIADLNRRLNEIDGLINQFQERKKLIRRKISKKEAYKGLLIADIEAKTA